MLAAVLILGTGEDLWLRFVPKYLEYLGAGVAVIAAYGTLKDLLDAVYQYPGGWLADRLGRRKALALFTLLAAAGYLAYLVSPGWGWVLAGTFLVMAWSSLALPALFAVIADSLPPERRALGFGVQSLLKRVPAMVAPPLGGLLIAALGLAAGMRVGLALTVVLALTAAVVVLRCYAESGPAGHEPARLAEVWRGMDRRLKRLLLADCLARWAEGIPKVFVVLYVVDVLRLTELDYGWLVAIQRLTAILLYIPLAKVSTGWNRKPIVLLTFTFFALFPLALASASGFTWAALAFVVAGLWEIGEPARKALIVDLAHEQRRGRTVGAYYLVRGLVVFPASLAGGALWAIDPRLPFGAAFLCGVVGIMVYAVWGPGDVAPVPVVPEKGGAA